MKKNIAKIQLRQDTSINWRAKNPILALGEPGYAIDTGELKIGDGETRWINLIAENDTTGCVRFTDIASTTKTGVIKIGENSSLIIEEDGTLYFDRTELDSIDTRLEAVTGQVTDIATDVADIEDDIIDLQVDIDSINSDIQGINENVSNVNSRIDDIISDLNTNVKQSITDLENRVTLAEDSVIDLGKSLSDSVEDLEEQISNTKEKLNDSISDLEERVEQAEDSVTALNTRVNENTSSITSLSGEVVAVKNRVTTNESSISSLGENVSTVSEAVSDINNDIELIEQDIETIKSDILNKEFFRGYFVTVNALKATTATNNDYAYVAETGTVWVYHNNEWEDSEEPIPSGLYPASDSLPLMDGEATPGLSTSYARGDHVHPSDTSKLDKVSSITEYEQLYAKTAHGVETMENVSTDSIANTIPKRDASGNINVGVPVEDSNATSKSYVDSTKPIEIVASDFGFNLSLKDRQTVQGKTFIDVALSYIETDNRIVFIKDVDSVYAITNRYSKTVEESDTVTIEYKALVLNGVSLSNDEIIEIANSGELDKIQLTTDSILIIYDNKSNTTSNFYTPIKVDVTESKDNTFSGKNIFNGDVEFNSEAIFKAYFELSGENVFGGENTFNGTTTFNGQESFTNGVTFNGNNEFNGTNTFNDLTTVNELKVNGSLLDKDNSKGTSGQILQTTESGIQWVDKESVIDVVANPEEEATESLSKLQVGETVYEIPKDKITRVLTTSDIDNMWYEQRAFKMTIESTYDNGIANVGGVKVKVDGQVVCSVESYNYPPYLKINNVPYTKDEVESFNIESDDWNLGGIQLVRGSAHIKKSNRDGDPDYYYDEDMVIGKEYNGDSTVTLKEDSVFSLGYCND